MAFYYVKTDGANDGTATGDGGRYATKQTGAFSGLGVSGYYATINLAVAATTPPVAGDFILVSDAHDFSSTATISYTGLTSGGVFLIMVVSDTAIDADRGANRAKATSTAGGADIAFSSLMAIRGLEFTPEDNIIINQFTNVNAEDCLFNITGSGDLLSLVGDGCSAYLVDCEIDFGNIASSISLGGGATFSMVGGAATTATAGITNFISGLGGNGGTTIDFVGVDLTKVTGTIINGIGANQGTDDHHLSHFDRCKLASGVVLVGEAFNSLNQRAVFTRCSFVSGEAEHQLYIKTFSGEVFDDDVIRRADDEPFTDSATDVSYKVVTNSQCGPGAPLWFDFPTLKWAELSAGASDTLRFFIASTVALTTSEVWAELVYPDGTTKQLANFVSTRGFPLDSTALTTDSASDWRDGAGAFTGNEYQIDVDTSGDVGADSYPSVRVYVTKASTTLYVASDNDAV